MVPIRVTRIGTIMVQICVTRICTHMLILPLILFACTGATDDTADTASETPAASTAWYFGTSDGQTPDGGYVAPTDEILFIRALDPAASTITENAWTVSPTNVSAYELVHAVDVATGTFTSTFVTDDGTMLVSGAYDAGPDWGWTAWHSTSVYQNGTYEGMRVESVDHTDDAGVATADKTVYDAEGTETYDIVEVLTPTDEGSFNARLAEIGG